MDIDAATTLAYLAFSALVLLVAGTGLRKDLKNAGGSFVFAGIGLLASLVVLIPLSRVGVDGAVEATIYWYHTMPVVGWMLIGSFIVGVAMPVPCLLHAASLARAGMAERRRNTRVTTRLTEIRHDLPNSH